MVSTRATHHAPAGSTASVTRARPAGDATGITYGPSPSCNHRSPSIAARGQKRVGVARATVTRAEVVLYDEPAAGLDPVTSQKIFDLLRREQRETGATVVMVSSDIDRLLTVTDRVGMMYKGSLVFDGTTAEALASLHPAVKQFIHGEVDGPL